MVFVPLLVPVGFAQRSREGSLARSLGILCFLPSPGDLGRPAPEGQLAWGHGQRNCGSSRGEEMSKSVAVVQIFDSGWGSETELRVAIKSCRMLSPPAARSV